MRANVLTMMAVLASGACGGPPELPDQSGDRLRARYLVPVGADADLALSGVRIGWHDRELDMDCAFVRDTDGVHRCLPELEGGLRVFPTSTCDSGEAMALLRGSSSGAPSCDPAFVRTLYESQYCDQPTSGEVLEIVGPSSASQATHGYVQTFFGDCNPWDPTPGSSWTFCETRPAPRSRFVEAQVELRQVGDVRQELLHGADGSVEAHRLLHPTLDATVYRDWLRGEDLVPAVDGGLLQCDGDAVCSTVAPPECANAVLVQDGCSLEARPVTGGQTCSDGCFDLGPALPALPYVETPVGGARLRPLWVEAGGEPVLPTGLFFDAELDVACASTALSDGREVCAPIQRGSAEWIDVFGDAECATRLGRAYVSTCDLPVPGHRWDAASETVMRVTPLGPTPAEVYTGFVVEEGVVYGCQPVAEASSTLYVEVPVAGADDLVKLEVVVQ